MGRKSETYFWDCDGGRVRAGARDRQFGPHMEGVATPAHQGWPPSCLRNHDPAPVRRYRSVSRTRFRSGPTSRAPRRRAPRKAAMPSSKPCRTRSILYDPETYRLSYANENARRRLRLDLENLQRFSILDLLNADEKRRFRDHIAPILSGEAPARASGSRPRDRARGDPDPSGRDARWHAGSLSRWFVTPRNARRPNRSA